MRPTSNDDMWSDDFWSVGPIEPTIVTSRPSRIQTNPSAPTTSQCQCDQGSRSSRLGTFVSMVVALTLVQRIGHRSSCVCISPRINFAAGEIESRVSELRDQLVAQSPGDSLRARLGAELLHRLA